MQAQVQLVVICLLLYLQVISCVNNGLGRTPQMAWSAWNSIQCGVNQTNMMESAQAIVDLGLAKAGYQYVNMDDCWANQTRNATGYIQPDPTKFPDGIKKLADFVHSLGLKFGLYSDSGTETCAGFPGSLGYETQDATQYASWGVDYLKYDNCANHGIPDYPRYLNMSKALNATGRPIFFSLCDWTITTAAWGPSLANSWRTTTDVMAEWPSIMNNIDQSNLVAKAAGPGGWNDPDMLEVGNGDLTLEENIAHFSLWAIAKAPLILGNDVRYITPNITAIITNPEVIAINQDPLGAQAIKLSVNVAERADISDTLVISAPCVKGLASQQWGYNINYTLTSGLNGNCLGGWLQPWNCETPPWPGVPLYATSCYDMCDGNGQHWLQIDTGVIRSFWSEIDLDYCISRVSEFDFEVAMFPCNSTDPITHALQKFQLMNDGTIRTPDGFCLTISGGQEVWGGPLSNGEYAALLLNRAEVNQTINISWTQLGLPVNTKAMVRDLWLQKDLGVFQDEYSATLDVHAVNLIKVTPAV